MFNSSGSVGGTSTAVTDDIYTIGIKEPCPDIEIQSTHLNGEFLVLRVDAWTEVILLCTCSFCRVDRQKKEKNCFE